MSISEYLGGAATSLTEVGIDKRGNSVFLYQLPRSSENLPEVLEDRKYPRYRNSTVFYSISILSSQDLIANSTHEHIVYRVQWSQILF